MPNDQVRAPSRLPESLHKDLRDPTSAISDADLVLMLRDRTTNTEATDLLYMRYECFCMRLAVRWTPAPGLEREIAYDVLEHFVTHEMDPVTRSFDVTGSLKGFLARCVWNKCLDEGRRIQRQRAHEAPMSLGKDSDDPAALLPSKDILVLDEMVRREDNALLRQCINRLPHEDRQVLTLTFLEERKGQEAGRILGVANSTVTYRTNRALVRLREILEAVGVKGVFHAGHDQ